MSMRGSYANGFAPRDGLAQYPSLWNGCIFAACPSLGATGLALRDWSGYGNHGVLTNMDAGTDWVASEGKLALDFDGSDDYVLLGDISATIWSFSAWIMMKAYPISFGRLFAQASYQCEIAFDAGGTLHYYGGAGWVPFGAVGTGTWQHICAIYDGTTVRFFRNGLQSGTDHTGGRAMAGGSLLGESQGFNVNDAFNGQKDDIRIYNRAITPSVLATLAMRRGIAYELARRAYVRGATVGGPVIPVFRHHYSQQGVA